MSGGQFQAEPDQIELAGRAFTAAAGELSGHTSAFSAAAQDVDGAFGLLGPSTDLLEAYVRMTRDTVEGLEKLRETVELTGQGLAQTARNYRQAEADSTMAGGQP